ncbi:MAG: hypothetical protein U0414_01250 [Polyangiaceae bacterium]
MKALFGASPARLAFSILAAAGLAAAAFVTDTRVAQAGDDPSNQFSVSATQSGSTVTIVVKPSSDKYFVNTDYNIKIKLAPKAGGTVSQEKLTKADARFADSGHEGKAKSATFTVTADHGVTGEGKVVICALDSCGNPTEFKFESK